jgi:cell division protein FtsB
MGMKKLLKYGGNFYVLSVLFFLFWMIFIDSNNIVNHIRMSRQISQLEDQKEFYLEKKEKIKAEREELVSNSELLEKFAREKYLMKKPTEDIYVIVEK